MSRRPEDDEAWLYGAAPDPGSLGSPTRLLQEILERIPAGRWGSPDDLQGAVVFLASEASRYIHGYTLAVDGGWLAR